MNPTHDTLGSPASPDLQRLLDAELSLRSRVGYVLLLLASLGMACLAGSLWATEPALPVRTQVAFALIISIALGWVSFSIWVLRHRRVLYARDRIVAGRMAVTFTSIFVLGTLAAGYQTGNAAVYWAAALGLVLLGVAVVMLARGHRAFNRLAGRREALERAMGRRS